MYVQPSPRPSMASSLSSAVSSAAVSSLWRRVQSSALLSHFNSLYVAHSSVGQLPPVCEQIHLGVVEASQFRTLMELLHTLDSHCQQQDEDDTGKRGQGEAGEVDGRRKHSVAAAAGFATNVVEASSGDSGDVSYSSASVGSGSDGTSSPQSRSSMSASCQLTSPASAGAAAGSAHTSQSAGDTLALSSVSSSSSSPRTSLPRSLPTSGFASPAASSSSVPAVPSTPRVRAARTGVSATPPPSRAEVRDGVALVAERDRFCKPSRLITVYPSKPFLITPIHLERLYVTSRKAAEAMGDEEKAELATITVRWMGKPTADELFLVATDVCALINIRKSNTAKTVAQFADGEKVSMPVHCSSGKGSSTHILTVLTLAGVRRLLTTSRSVLATSLLDYLTRIAVHLQHFPHYVPVNDPLKPTVTPLKAESHSQLIANPAASGLSSPPPLPSPASQPAYTQPVAHSAAASPAEPAVFASPPYASDSHSEPASTSATSFPSPAASIPSSSHSDSSTALQLSGGSGGTSAAFVPFAPPFAAPLTAPMSALSPTPSSSSAAELGVAGWPVKREHVEADSARNDERVDGERGTKRRADKLVTDEAELSSAGRQQRRRVQYRAELQLDGSDSSDSTSPLPLPVLDDSRGSLYAADISHTASSGSSSSSGQQSPSAPDSPSALSYSNFHSSSLGLAPLHYTHSPPFMSSQPPSTLLLGECADPLLYVPPYHPPYFPSASRTPQQQYGYYLSPQHRPLTAPPMPPFTHHALQQHVKPLDDYASSAHTPQLPQGGASSGLLHPPHSDSTPSSVQSSGGELTLPPPLYQPGPLHSLPPSCCAHCQHSQHAHQQQRQHSHGSSAVAGMYGSRRAPGSPLPPPLPPSASYSAYPHTQLLPPHPSPHGTPHSYFLAHTHSHATAHPHSGGHYSSSPPASYTHSSHHSFHIH